MKAASISSSVRVAADFLRSRFGATPGELYVLVWTLKVTISADGERRETKRSHWLRVDQLADAEGLLAPLCEPDAGNVYYGAALSPQDFGCFNRCKAEQAAGIVGLWADIDIKGPNHKSNDLPETIEQARELADSLDLPVTQNVFTGGGIQPAWLFREPWIFTDAADRQRAATLVSRWLAALRAKANENGWSLDATQDLARVLRLPGSHNCKSLEHDAPGEPVPVKVLDDTGPRYEIGDFLAVLPPEEPEPEPPSSDGKFTMRMRAGPSVIDMARKYVAKMPEAVSKKRGHDKTWAVAQVLTRGFDLTVDQARPLMEEYNQRCRPEWSDKELEHKLNQAREKSRLPRGYILNKDRADRNGHAERNGTHEGNGTADKAAPPHAEGMTGVAVILTYFRERYRPDFRAGNSIHCQDGRTVPMGEACAVPDSRLIALLAEAVDAPCFKGGGTNRNALPGFFRTWAKVAWGDLLADLPDEDAAEFGPDAAAPEEFRRLVREALLSEVVLGDVIGATGATQLERRPLIDWCQKFAKVGPWRDIRGKRCWCKCVEKEGGELVLMVAIRHEVFSQVRADKRLCEMGHKAFTRRAARYGVGKSSVKDRPHGSSAVVLADNFLADLLDALPGEGL